LGHRDQRHSSARARDALLSSTNRFSCSGSVVRDQTERTKHCGEEGHMPWELDHEFNVEQKRLQRQPILSGTPHNHEWAIHWQWMFLGYLTLVFSQHLIASLAGFLSALSAMQRDGQESSFQLYSGTTLVLSGCFTLLIIASSRRKDGRTATILSMILDWAEVHQITAFGVLGFGCVSALIAERLALLLLAQILSVTQFGQFVVKTMYVKTTIAFLLPLVLFGILIWIGRQRRTTL
jgi:hypothetical protein